MKIAVVGYYGFNNFGDEINLLEMIKLIKTQYSKAEITVFGRALWHTFMQPEYNLVLTAGIKQDEFRRMINRFDLVIIGGGGLVYLGAHFFNYLDEGITVPYIFSRVGIDDRKVDAHAIEGIKNVLKKASNITLRTRGDLKMLKKHFSMSCEVVPEAIWNYRATQIKLPSAKKKVLISLNRYTGKFTNDIKKSLSKTSEPIYEYIMSMQDTTIDNYYNIKATNTKNRKIIPDSIGLHGKGNCLASVDLTITSRLHAALVSINHGVPAIMLKSTPKLKFLAEELGMVSWFSKEAPSAIIIEKMLEDKESKQKLLIERTAAMRKGASRNIIP